MSDPINLVNLVSEFGPNVALVIFFIWRSDKNFSRLLQRVVECEDFVRDTLMEIVSDSNQNINDSTTAIKESTETIKDLKKQITNKG